MKKIIMLGLVVTAMVSGCKYPDNVQSTSNDIKETFSFAKAENVLQYHKQSDNVFVVKADDKLYLYIKDGKHSIIAPGPKSYNLEKTEYYEQTVKNPDYKFVTVFDNTQQDSLNEAAKLDNSDAANEPSAKAEERPQVHASAPKPSTETPALHENNMAHQAESAAAAQKATDEGEARLKELREKLAKRLKDARFQPPATSKVQQASAQVKSSNQESFDTTRPSPLKVLPGQQFAVFNGTQVLKVDYNADGTKVTPEEKKQKIIDFANKLPMSWTINFPAIGEEKTQLFVFTDYTCPFCRKLHNDIPLLNQHGITVRYLFYPRSYSAGPEQPVAKMQLEQMRRAWCAPDQGEAMSELFETREIEDYKCEEVSEAKGRPNFPGVYQHFLGTLFEIDGTPAYFTNTGMFDQGYTNVSTLENKILNK